MDRLIRLLASARLAAWLIVALIGFLSVSFLIPQQGIFPVEETEAFLEALPAPVEVVVVSLGLDSIFTSWVFLAVAALLAVNLLVCTLRRVAARTRARRRTPTRAIPNEALVIGDVSPENVHDAMMEYRAVFSRDEDGHETRYRVRRGEIGFVGSFILHIALITLAVGGVATGLTTFRGEMVLTEGQTRADVAESYLSISETPRFGEAFGEFSITLERMIFTYEDGTVVDAVARAAVVEQEVRRVEDARVNYPLLIQGKSFLLLDAGHSVWITVTDQAGTLLADSFVNLASVTEMGYVDRLELGGTTISLLSRPDDTVPYDRPVEEGLNLTSPIVGIATTSPSGPDEYTWLRPGDSATLDGVTVSVREVRLWNRFLVRADGGRYIVYAAFFLVIVGALLRFVDPDRYVNVVVRTTDGTSDAHVWGRARYDLGFNESLLTKVSRSIADQADSPPFTESTAGKSS